MSQTSARCAGCPFTVKSRFAAFARFLVQTTKVICSYCKEISVATFPNEIWCCLFSAPFKEIDMAEDKKDNMKLSSNSRQFKQVVRHDLRLQLHEASVYRILVPDSKVKICGESPFQSSVPFQRIFVAEISLALVQYHGNYSGRETKVATTVRKLPHSRHCRHKTCIS